MKVRKKDLDRLTTEVMQLRDFLPRVLSGDALESAQKLKVVEKSEFRFTSHSPNASERPGPAGLRCVDACEVTVNNLQGTVTVLSDVWENRKGGRRSSE